MKKDIEVFVVDKEGRLKSGIVRHFNVVKNKIGTYKIEDVRRFARKIIKFIINFGINTVYACLVLGEKVDDTFDKMLDKVFDYYNRLYEKKENVLVEQEDTSFQEKKRIVLSDGDVRHFSFDTLAPLYKGVDYMFEDQDDIIELRELKNEILTGNIENSHSENNGNSRRR